MKNNSVGFFVNQYDEDGDIWSKGIYIAMNNMSIKIGEYKDLVDFIDNLQQIKEEIEETYEDIVT